MDVWAITVTVVRRWFVVLPVLVATVVAAYLLGANVAPEYDIRSSWLIVPGPALDDPTVDVPNPYGSIASAASAVQTVLTSPQTSQEITSRGLSSAYEVAVESRTALITVTVRADQPQVGIDTAEALRSFAVEELATRQSAAGVRMVRQFSVDTLAAPAVVEVIDSGQLRVRAVVGAAGLVAALMLALVVDNLIINARRRRDARRTAAAEDAAEPGTSGLGATTNHPAEPDGPTPVVEPVAGEPPIIQPGAPAPHRWPDAGSQTLQPDPGAHPTAASPWLPNRAAATEDLPETEDLPGAEIAGPEASAERTDR